MSKLRFGSRMSFFDFRKELSRNLLYLTNGGAQQRKRKANQRKALHNENGVMAPLLTGFICWL